VEPASNFLVFGNGRRSGAEKRGCDQSQEGQDLSAAAAVEQLIFKTSTEKQTVHLTNKDLTKDSQRFSPWLHSAWRTTGPIRSHAAAGGCMKVQTCGDTCEGACAVEQCTKNTIQPGWTGPFLTRDIYYLMYIFVCVSLEPIL
jgi:hypothetical protein